MDPALAVGAIGGFEQRDNPAAEHGPAPAGVGRSAVLPLVEAGLGHLRPAEHQVRRVVAFFGRNETRISCSLRLLCREGKDMQVILTPDEPAPGRKRTRIWKGLMSDFSPQLSIHPMGHGVVEVRLGHDLLDDYLRFVAARCRPNSVLAAGFDLKVFFTAVSKEPVTVTMTDIFEFIAAQRLPTRGGNVVRLQDREAGLSARTIRRRLATLSGLYGYLEARNLTTKNPVPTGLSVRRPSDHRSKTRSTPLIRTPRTLPRILDSTDATALLAATRTARDRAMLLAMLLGGLCRCEVLGLQLADIDVADQKVTITQGKGGHHRIVPVAPGFFAALTDYLNDERPAETAVSEVFVVLKGPRRGLPLSAGGVDEIISGARGGPAWVGSPAICSATPAWPGCGKLGCRWKRCKPKPVTAASSRPESICICRRRGSPGSTTRRSPRWTPLSLTPVGSDEVHCRPFGGPPR